MSSKTVLVVEDEPAIRRLVEYHLQREGYTVVLAENGQQGLAAARAHRPDLVVLDVMMVGLNGFDVCRQLRAEPETANTPVLFVTARSATNDKLFAFKNGADDYLTKPFEIEELKARVAALLARVARAEASVQPLPGRAIALYSPKGGVGTTTLAVQLSAAVAARAQQPVLLIDLALPLGSVAAHLHLDASRHVANLLALPPAQISVEVLQQYAPTHTLGFQVIPAPAQLTRLKAVPTPAALESLLAVAKSAGYLIILDLGSTLTELTLTALRLVDRTLVVTSGLPVANQLLDAFLEAAPALGLELNQLHPVINEVNGSTVEVRLSRPPVARIPQAQGQPAQPLWEDAGWSTWLVAAALSGVPR